MEQDKNAAGPQHDKAPQKPAGRHRLRQIVALVCIVAVVGALAGVLSYHGAKKAALRQQYAAGWVPLAPAMEALGFWEENAGYTNAIYRVVFQMEDQVAYKDRFRYSLAGNTQVWDGQTLIRAETLAAMLHYQVDAQGGAVPLEYHWGDYRTVAHATGAEYSETGIQNYPNSHDALVQNYEMGQRVFEVDFLATADGHLLVGRGEEADNPPYSQWLAEHPGFAEKALPVDDLMYFMYIHKDMFIITDTKTKDYDQNITQLTLLRQAAEKYDIAIMDRIIPQIYFRGMQHWVREIYDFPEIVYTLYATDDTPEDVLGFIRQEEGVTAVAMWPNMATEEFVAALDALGRRVYVHTVNDLAEAAECMRRGVYGLYTDTLYKEDADRILQYCYSGDVPARGAP